MSNQASTVPTNPTCPDCGTPLAFGALAGMCPACLLKSGASADSVTQAGRIPFIPPTVEELAALFPALEILEFIGKGGMGAVYKARQRQLDRIVALKVLPPALGDDAAFAERFAREARALAKLNHPGIVTLYEFGHVTQPTGPLFYILMEFVDGVNLRQLLSGGRISPREALAIVPQICDALQFAHDRGIVHRDIKPENLLIDRRGAVKVADFGLAKLVGNDGRAGSPLPDGDSPVDNGAQQTARPTNDLTDAGKVMGTPRYMAPEQSERPSEVDHRADIYALGVVFYQMLTGELPAKELRPPSTKVQIDVRLDEIVLRALERNPSHRYAAVSEMKTQVNSFVDSERRNDETNAPERNLKESNGKQANLVFWILLLALVGLGAYRGASAGNDLSNLQVPLAISTLLSLTAISIWWSFRKFNQSAGSRMQTAPGSQRTQVALSLAGAALIFLGARGFVSSIFSLSMMGSLVTGQPSGASGFKLENFTGPSWIRSYLAGLPASTASKAILAIVAGGIVLLMVPDLVALLGGWGLRSRRNYRTALTGACLLLAKTSCPLAFRNATPVTNNSTAVWLGLLVELWILATLLRPSSRKAFAQDTIPFVKFPWRRVDFRKCVIWAASTFALTVGLAAAVGLFIEPIYGSQSRISIEVTLPDNVLRWGTPSDFTELWVRHVSSDSTLLALASDPQIRGWLAQKLGRPPTNPPETLSVLSRSMELRRRKIPTIVEIWTYDRSPANAASAADRIAELLTKHGVALTNSALDKGPAIANAKQIDKALQPIRPAFPNWFAIISMCAVLSVAAGLWRLRRTSGETLLDKEKEKNASEGHIFPA